MIRSSTISKTKFIFLAASMLWIKTYLVYKTSFDIKIENLMQEFILLINPLSFLLLFFGVSFFMKEKSRNKFIIFASFISSFVLFANVVFYRFFNDFLTLPVLFQTSNMGDLGTSITESLRFTDPLLFIDVVILILIHKYRPSFTKIKTITKRERRAYFIMVAFVFFLNLGLAEIQRPQLLTRTFDREMLVKNIGTYNYQIYDIVLQSKSSAQRALADSSSFIEIENYLKANQKDTGDTFGIAHGKNVVIISMESLQNFVINETIDGEEITPFLNDFINESYYFENFYHQTGQGKTSDSEFLLENSLYPLGRGAVFFTHANNEYKATPEIVKEYGYFSSVLHANNKTFWNRDIMYDSLGYDKFFDIESYEVTEENSIGWGLKDIDFFEQSIDLLKSQPQPYYSKFITLTNHFPFELEEQDKMVNEYHSNSRTLNRYFPTVRYMDESLKVFFDRLKEEGMYENTIFILYGDHYGISENHNKAMAQFLEKDEITPFDSVQLQRVPLIIHIPGVTDKDPQVISEVSGQIDLKPTILSLLGIDIKNDVHFGNDLFAKDRFPFTVLRDGSFITDKYVFTKNACYDKATGEETELELCEPYMEKAGLELDYSDEIIYGDLLRFYEGTSYSEHVPKKFAE